MTTEYIGFFNDSTYRVIDGNIVYAKDLNNPMAALETGLTSLTNAVQTGATILTGADTGTVNAYVIDPTAALTELTDGQMVWLKPGATNTGASTINVSSLGVKNIRSTVRTSLVGGELLSGYWHMLKYSSTLDAFVIVSERGKTDIDTEKTIAGGTGITVVSTDDTITVYIEDGGVDTTLLADEAVTQDKISPLVSIGPKAIQTFTSSGTYNPTSGVTVAVVEVVGGGGEGGDGAVQGTGGGGAGGYSKKRISLSGISSVVVTVGAGGTGGTTTGNNGGTSSFGAHCSATGGTGSANTGSIYAVGGAGGAGAGGDINITGETGCSVDNIGGSGGSSVLGGGGNGTFGIGGAGVSPGAGGAGGGAGASYAGGDGATGIVIVTEY